MTVGHDRSRRVVGAKKGGLAAQGSHDIGPGGPRVGGRRVEGRVAGGAEDEDASIVQPQRRPELEADGGATELGDEAVRRAIAGADARPRVRGRIVALGVCPLKLTL